MGECKISSAWLIVIPTLSIKRRSFIPPHPRSPPNLFRFFFPFFWKLKYFGLIPWSWVDFHIPESIVFNLHCYSCIHVQHLLFEILVYETQPDIFYSATNAWRWFVDCGLRTKDWGPGIISQFGIALIYDTCHLCTCSRIDGIKATCMSHGISGGKQVIKFSNTNNRGLVYLFCQNKTTIS